MFSYFLLGVTKQAQLVPADDITVYYKTSENLAKIIRDHGDYIFSTIKQPLEAYPVPSNSQTIIQEAGIKVSIELFNSAFIKQSLHANTELFKFLNMKRLS